MIKNESTMDRAIRAIVGVVILYVAYAILTGLVAFLGYIVGIVLLFTAITGYCPLYKILGISTLK